MIGKIDKTPQLNIFKIILSQQKKAKKKIYSIHELNTQCIAKGKESKKYEFGNKTSIVKTRKSGIIIGALAFKEKRCRNWKLEIWTSPEFLISNFQF